jgi:cytochrome c553
LKPYKIAASIALVCWSVCAVAQSPAPDYFVANCFNCHGTYGRSNSAIPQLAGLNKPYIIEQINAFKSGTRPATVMQQLAKGYTDDEIARAAEYFSKQKK